MVWSVSIRLCFEWLVYASHNSTASFHVCGTNQINHDYFYGAVHSSPLSTDRVDVEAVGADEGDCLLQVIVQDSILEVLVGHHGESQGTHRVLAQVGELHLKADCVAHAAVSNDVAITRLPVHQHIWETFKCMRAEDEMENLEV